MVAFKKFRFSLVDKFLERKDFFVNARTCFDMVFYLNELTDKETANPKEGSIII